LVILDGDGQHNPAEIPAFLDALGACDVVIGNRFMSATKHETPAYRKAMIDIVNASLGVGDAQCGFRAYNRKAIQTINVKEEGMGASIEILQQAKKLGLRIREVPCAISYRDTKHSQHPLTHGYDLVEVIFWHYVWEKPLRTLGISSIISLFLGVLFSIWLLVEYASSRWFAPSLAFLGLGFLLFGVLLGFFAMLVLIFKKLLKELK